VAYPRSWRRALTPAERLAFVLHDMFAVPFEMIADRERIGQLEVVPG